MPAYLCMLIVAMAGNIECPQGDLLLISALHPPKLTGQSDRMVGSVSPWLSFQVTVELSWRVKEPSGQSELRISAIYEHEGLFIPVVRIDPKKRASHRLACIRPALSVLPAPAILPSDVMLFMAGQSVWNAALAPLLIGPGLPPPSHKSHYVICHQPWRLSLVAKSLFPTHSRLSLPCSPSWTHKNPPKSPPSSSPPATHIRRQAVIRCRPRLPRQPTRLSSAPNGTQSQDFFNPRDDVEGPSSESDVRQ
ncbi:unnamed protein product [Protopolystoma xenopodis]|uniref:Uncharacterized protein n=1 Tax=Protopolystoma xenopodis TaxID=117903 RepID=A0A3S5AH42_9PLAT|nr:unnamed protein product [Protopolystoma xenopodis]